MSENKESKGSGLTKTKVIGSLISVFGLLLVSSIGFYFWNESQNEEQSTQETPKNTDTQNDKPTKPPALPANDANELDKLYTNKGIGIKKDTLPIQTTPTITEVPPIGQTIVENLHKNNQDVVLEKQNQLKQQGEDQKQQDYYQALKSKDGFVKLSSITVGKQSFEKPAASAVATTTKSVNPTIAEESMAKQPDSNEVVLAARQEPPPFGLKPGTVLPCTLTKAVDTEVGGSVTCVVSRNIFDTATHSIILIPQGATLFGLYDNNIAYNDTRLPTAFKTLTYPDGSFVDLKAAPGYDLAGKAGLKDEVDNRYWQLFGSSFIMGTLQFANNASGNLTNGDAGQQVGGNVGQQASNTGMNVTNKLINVRPIIKIRAGYKANVELQNWIVLPPRKNQGQ